ncbi:hypothetical protein [Candidatus Electronema sp. JM]|uniref:hypothetical protein n=1 Tax=Candidatus Electronema sp. JM TaxID=3401571 RepID=UPI003AA8813B
MESASQLYAGNNKKNAGVRGTAELLRGQTLVVNLPALADGIEKIQGGMAG